MSGSRPQREVAHRLFAAEFADSTVSHTDSDEEMAPTYVVTPTGGLVNRVFVVGALTRVEQVGDDIYRGRINDPTGAFVVYAGQYQPDAANFLADAEPPVFVALTGKARTFQPDGSDRILTSVRPEHIVETAADGRDRWLVEAARHTLARIELYAHARAAGVAPDELESYLLDVEVDPGLARGIPIAVARYDTSATYLEALRERVVETLTTVFEDGEGVTPFELDVGADTGSATFADLATTTFADAFRADDAPPLPEPAPSSAPADPDQPTSTADTAQQESSVEAPTDPAPPEPPDELPSEATSAPEEADVSDDSPSAPSPPPEETEAAEPEATTEQYELSDEEREAVEEEYGTEFETGGEVDSPQSTLDATPATEDDSSTETAESEDDDSDLESIVVEHMEALDDGNGVDRGTLLAAVEDEVDAGAGAIDDAIQDALMSGTCYEPEEGRLKPI